MTAFFSGSQHPLLFGIVCSTKVCFNEMETELLGGLLVMRLGQLERRCAPGCSHRQRQAYYQAQARNLLSASGGVGLLAPGGCEGHPSVAMGTSQSLSLGRDPELRTQSLLPWELPRYQHLPLAHPLELPWARRWGWVLVEIELLHLQLLLWKNAFRIQSNQPVNTLLEHSL